MTNTKFINQLLEWYNNSIPKTKYLCKFYLQASTFSYELHDETKCCFTSESLKYESKVFWWGGEKHNAEIIADIKKNAKALMKSDEN